MTRRELLKKTAVAVVGMPLMGKIARADSGIFGDFKRNLQTYLNREFKKIPYANPPAPESWWADFSRGEFRGEPTLICRVYAKPRCTGYTYAIKRNLSEANVGLSYSASDAANFICLWGFGSSSAQEERNRRDLHDFPQGSIWVCGSEESGPLSANTSKHPRSFWNKPGCIWKNYDGIWSSLSTNRTL